MKYNPFMHVNLWSLPIDELKKRQLKIVEDIKIGLINTLIATTVATVLYYYEYEHLALILFSAVILLVLSYLDDKRRADTIDYIVYLKNKHIEERVW